jgi:acyl-CoA synthetase (AMP-forming)/AMP-acid ligase II
MIRLGLGENAKIHGPSFPRIELASEKSFLDCVMQHFYKFGNREAIVNGTTGEVITFSALKSAVKVCSGGLQSRGLKKGEVFAIFAPNTPEWAVLYFAALRCGVILSTLNPAYREDELGHQIKDCGAAFLATVPELLGIAKTGAARCDTIREFFVFGEAPGATPFAELSRMGACWQFQPVEIDKQNDVAVLPYSSGTTGLPKGVQLTHHNLVANIKQMSECIFPNIGKKDTFLAVLPFFHIYGMNKVLAMGLRSGVRIVTMPKFEPKQYLQLLKKYDVTVAHVAPPLVNFLANNPLVKEVLPLTSLKELFCGAAPLGYELALKAKKRLGIPIVRQGYGMTELSPSSHASPYDSHKYGSCGRLLANMECKIVDVDTGKTRGVGPTEAGELWLRGPNIMKGYLNHPDADKTIIDAQGFLHTGDIGYVDEDGDYFIIDRLKELIKVKGFQVAPAEIEGLLLKHPEIEDAAIIGVAAKREGDGESPKAFVVRKANSNLTEAEVKAYVASTLAPYKHLGFVSFIKEIPRSASGKVLRKNLRFREALFG